MNPFSFSAGKPLAGKAGTSPLDVREWVEP